MEKKLLMSFVLLLSVLILGCPSKPCVRLADINCGQAPSVVLKPPETILELAEAYNRAVDIAVEENRIIKCYERSLRETE